MSARIIGADLDGSPETVPRLIKPPGEKVSQAQGDVTPRIPLIYLYGPPGGFHRGSQRLVARDTPSKHAIPCMHHCKVAKSQGAFRFDLSRFGK